MRYKHIHDAEKQIVYRFPFEAIVSENRDKKGTLISWSVHMKIEITRPDNRLINNQWEKPITSFPQQRFDARYNRDQVISSFHMRHDPRGEEISEVAYSALQQDYEARARGLG